jgi:hypothetical protein
MAVDLRREFPLLRGPGAISPIGPDALAAFERAASDRSARWWLRSLAMMTPDRAGSSRRGLVITIAKIFPQRQGKQLAPFKRE